MRPQQWENMTTRNPPRGIEDGLGQIPFQPIGSNSNNLIPLKTARKLFSAMICGVPAGSRILI